MKKLLFLLAIFCSALLFAQNKCIPATPKTLVNDYTKTLSDAEVNALERKLVAYNDTTSTQITIAILPDACGDDINLLAVEIAHQWGVGQRKEDNGCIILLSMESGNRKISIQNGYGLEEYLTDAMSKRIIEQVIIPEFKNNNYYGGLDQGTTAIMQLLAGKFEGHGPTKNKKAPFGAIIFIMIIVLYFVFGRNRGGGGGRGGYRGGYWIGGFGTGGFSGGGSSFGGGGGFGGFGGGGFGGGGASGSW